MDPVGIRFEINKRLTLNWLIQGAAQHAGLTAHHLVRDELDAIHPDLVRLYDLYALANLFQYWSPEAVLLLGWPPRFWKRAASSLVELAKRATSMVWGIPADRLDARLSTRITFGDADGARHACGDRGAGVGAGSVGSPDGASMSHPNASLSGPIEPAQHRLNRL